MRKGRAAPRGGSCRLVPGTRRAANASVTDFASTAAPALRHAVERALPGGRVTSVTALGPDTESHDATHKAAGYGVPLRIDAVDAGGKPHRFVFHTASPGVFGHDRRADRAAEMLLAFDDFPKIPGHVEAVDVGAIARSSGELVSLRDAGELYLLTRWAEGHVYAEELRALAARGRLEDRDARHCEALAGYLARLHEPRDDAAAWRRSVRDLVGSGEGIFGIIDGYPDDAPGAPPERLRAIERRCVDWRWRVVNRSDRLRRTHGDFHPFNLVFDSEDRLVTLDASRGCLGDAADDLCALSINYVFFALGHAGAWRNGLRPLWYRVWNGWMALTGERDVLDFAAPWLAWRGLVLANPAWYPDVGENERRALLGFVEHVLDAPRLDLDAADSVFA